MRFYFSVSNDVIDSWVDYVRKLNFSFKEIGFILVGI